MAFTHEKSKKRDKLFWVSTVLIPVLVTAGFFFAWLQMDRMEKGILDVCALQQDAYVELVVAQINLKDNRDNQEIITDILNTLDNSTNQYWVFSAGQTMLYVKDVLETNKYKGLTAMTYFDSPSARAFIESIRPGRVIHANILMGGQEYVASGVAFSYRGNAYNLCLLTNSSVLLDNNDLLGAQTELWLMILSTLGLLLLVPMLLVRRLREQRQRQQALEKNIRLLNESLEKVNERLSNRELYDTKKRLWKLSALSSFVEKIEEKAIAPVALLYIRCPRPEDRERFLDLAGQVLDHQVLRFEGEDSDLLLLFIEVDYATAYLNVAPLLSQDVTLVRARSVDYTGQGSFRDMAAQAQPAAAL